MPTVLSFGDGMLVADDLIDWSDLDSGITWTRGAWTRGDRNLMEQMCIRDSGYAKLYGDGICRRA